MKDEELRPLETNRRNGLRLGAFVRGRIRGRQSKEQKKSREAKRSTKTTRAFLHLRHSAVEAMQNLVFSHLVKIASGFAVNTQKSCQTFCICSCKKFFNALHFVVCIQLESYI